MRQLFRSSTSGLGALCLALAGVSSALVYYALLTRFPLLTLYTRAILNLNHMKPDDWPRGLLVVVCMILLFGAYALGALGVRARGRLAPLLIVGFPLIFIPLLLLTQPITSTDVYDYLFRGRMLARYEANTFVITPQTFVNDPLFKYVAWRKWVTAYGPLWEQISWGVARLGGEAPSLSSANLAMPLLKLIFAYKALAVLGFLLCGAAIWGALGRIAPDQRWFGLYLWLWNPLVIWESVAAAHNDAWMMLLIVLAAWAIAPWGKPASGSPGEARPRALAPPLSVPRSLLALLALTLGGLIKFLAFFFGPALLIAGLRRLPTWRERMALVALGGAVCLGLIALMYAPFWEGWGTLRNVGDRRSLFTATPLASLRALLATSLPAERANSIMASASLALLAAGVYWSVWRAWHAPGAMTAHFLWLMLWFLFVSNPWFQPWYAIWPLALVALQPWRARLVWSIGLLGFTSMLSYIVGGLLIPMLGYNDKSVGRELLISAFIYLPPLIALGWPWLRSGIARLPWPRVSRRRLAEPVERPGRKFGPEQSEPDIGPAEV